MFKCDVILIPKNMKIGEVGKLGTGLCLSQKLHFSIKTCNFFLNLSLIVTSLTPYDPCLGVVIKNAKFRVYMSNSFKKLELKKMIKHKTVCCVTHNPQI